MRTSRTFLARLMQDAWALARQGAQTFGGNASLYFACALRLVWADTRPQTVWHPGTGNVFWLPGVPLAVVPPRNGRLFLPGLGQ